MRPNPQVPEKILNGKLHFLCSISDRQTEYFRYYCHSWITSFLLSGISFRHEWFTRQQNKEELSFFHFIVYQLCSLANMLYFFQLQKLTFDWLLIVLYLRLLLYIVAVIELIIVPVLHAKQPGDELFVVIS